MINLDPVLLGSVGVLFLVLLVLVNRMLISPMVLHMDNRKKSIEDGLQKAGGDNEEVAALEAEATKVIHDAKHAAYELREQKIAEAKAKLEQKIAAKKAEIEAEIEKFHSTLQEQKAELKNAILSQAPLFKESLKAKLIATSNLKA